MHKTTVLPTSVFPAPVSYPRERTNQFLVYSARDIKCKYQHTDYICGVTLYAWLCTHLFFLYFGDFFHAALLFVMVASYFMYKWSIIYLISVVVVAYCSVDHCVHLFVSPGTAAHQASLTFTSSWSLLKHMSIVSVMPSNYLTLCHPLLLLPLVLPRIRVFSNESALLIRWPKYWSFSFSISPANEYSGLIQGCSPRDSQECSPAPQFESINSSALSQLNVVIKDI